MTHSTLWRVASSVALAALLFSGGVAAADSQEAERVAELARLLGEADRPVADKARDAGRKPAEVVAFLGIEPGAIVVDLIAASGYYSEVLSVAVGPRGKVFAQNNAYVLRMRDGANDKALRERMLDERLANVVRLDFAVAELPVEAGSVDAALTALNFHDVANARGREAAVAFLQAVAVLLKPGGTLGIIDHDGDAERDNNELHRIPLASVLEIVKDSPFEVEAQSEVLRNPKDDHSQSVFDPALRGNTDRFVLRLKKR